jgi:tetratricopeptide (TPR) repeat protein
MEAPEMRADLPEDQQRVWEAFQVAMTRGIDERITLLERLINEYGDVPFRAEMLAAAASNLNIRGRIDEAAERYRELLELRPESDAALEAANYLRELHRSRNEMEAVRNYSGKMLELVEEIAREEPERLDRDLGFMTVECLSDLDRLEEARAACERIKKVASADSTDLRGSKASVYLVQLLRRSGAYEEALREIHGLLALVKEQDRSGGLTLERAPAPTFDTTVAEIVEEWVKKGGRDELISLSREIDPATLVRDKDAKARIEAALGRNMKGATSPGR